MVPDEIEEYVAAFDAALPGRVEAVYLNGSVALGDFRLGISGSVGGEPLSRVRPACRPLPACSWRRGAARRATVADIALACDLTDAIIAAADATP